MARIKRVNKEIYSILHELVAIRNSLQLTQQSLTRLENRYAQYKKQAPTTSEPITTETPFAQPRLDYAGITKCLARQQTQKIAH